MTKICTECGETKELNDFHKNKRLKSGLCSCCKACAIKRTKAHYRANALAKRAYEAARYQTDKRKTWKSDYQQRYRAKYKDRYKAHTAVLMAVRTGGLTPQPCQDCGQLDNTEAHHEDYSKPMEIIWLCFRCHRIRHGQEVLTNIN